MHMNEHGITLRHGEKKGRLVQAVALVRQEERPRRMADPLHQRDLQRRRRHELAGERTVSGDGHRRGLHRRALATGRSTTTRACTGTNARISPGAARRAANDAGATWGDFRIVEVLPDGQQNRSYGCMGGLARLPVAGRDILLFSNIETPERDAGERHRLGELRRRQDLAGQALRQPGAERLFVDERRPAGDAERGLDLPHARSGRSQDRKVQALVDPCGRADWGRRNPGLGKDHPPASDRSRSSGESISAGLSSRIAAGSVISK